MIDARGTGSVQSRRIIHQQKQKKEATWLVLALRINSTAFSHGSRLIAVSVILFTSTSTLGSIYTRFMYLYHVQCVLLEFGDERGLRMQTKERHEGKMHTYISGRNALIFISAMRAYLVRLQTPHDRFGHMDHMFK